MKKTIILLCLFLLLLLSLGGCSGADGSKLPTIYTAGYYDNGTTYVPCYWTDGKKTDLVSGSLGGLAASISVSNGTVYIGGETDTGPCYWTNGVEHDLTPTNAIVRGISVSDGTVFSAGSYWSGTAEVACFWTGSSEQDLPGDGHSAEAYAIFVSGGTVYVAGDYNNGSIYIPCYWTCSSSTINKHDLSTSSGSARAICVSGSTIYAAGYAHYWVDGNPADLSGTAYAMFVDGETVYTAGVHVVGAYGVACYWKGTSETDLPGSGGAKCDAIYVFDGTVYTCGAYEWISGPSVACYWTGATKTDLQGANAEAISIFVVE